MERASVGRSNIKVSDQHTSTSGVIQHDTGDTTLFCLLLLPPYIFFTNVGWEEDPIV